MGENFQDSDETCMNISPRQAHLEMCSDAYDPIDDAMGLCGLRCSCSEHSTMQERELCRDIFACTWSYFSKKWLELLSTSARSDFATLRNDAQNRKNRAHGQFRG